MSITEAKGNAAPTGLVARSRTEISLSTAAILEVRRLGVMILDMIELYVFLAQRKRFIIIGVDVEKSGVENRESRQRKALAHTSAY